MKAVRLESVDRQEYLVTGKVVYGFGNKVWNHIQGCAFLDGGGTVVLSRSGRHWGELIFCPCGGDGGAVHSVRVDQNHPGGIDSEGAYFVVPSYDSRDEKERGVGKITVWSDGESCCERWLHYRPLCAGIVRLSEDRYLVVMISGEDGRHVESYFFDVKEDRLIFQGSRELTKGFPNSISLFSYGGKVLLAGMHGRLLPRPFGRDICHIYEVGAGGDIGELTLLGRLECLTRWPISFRWGGTVNEYEGDGCQVSVVAVARNLNGKGHLYVNRFRIGDVLSELV